MNKQNVLILLGLISNVYCSSSDEDDKLVKLIISPGLKYSEEILLNNNNIALVSPTKTTVFLLHGWTEGTDKPYYKECFDAYNQKGGYNLIRVDWTAYSYKNYFEAIKLVKNVGNRVARYIKILHANGTGVSLSKMHIVGHSLGAHAAGFAGKHVKELLNATIARITGLDPAGLGFGVFFDVASTERLANDDADMVDVLHTNRGVFGTANEIGSLNFYANDANFQPGCAKLSFDVTGLLFCSHQRSVSLFAESINSDKFVAYQFQRISYSGPIGVNKDVAVIFGENTNGITGRYAFKTNCKPPYAIIEPNCYV